MKIKLDYLRLSIFKLFKTIFLTVALWLSAFSLQEIDPGYISEDLLHYIYYEGRNTHTILYEDIRKTSNVNDYHANIQEYYKDYYETDVSSEKPDVTLEPDSLKQNFTKTLLNKYGNSTLLRLNLKDLELLVNMTILTDVQSFIFYESLLQHKTDRGKKIYGRSEFLSDSEIYLFNIIPLKSQAVFIFCLLIFLIVHNMQIYFIKKDKTTILFNIFTVSLSLVLVYKLYSWKYYFSSSIIFFQLCLGIKFFLDSIFIHLGYTKEEFDIFISISKTKTFTQFVLKFIIYTILALIIGILSFIYFNYLINYVIFYICIIQIIYLASYYYQYEVSPFFQPFKHFLLIFSGVINFFITKFNRKTHGQANQPIDSYYILSDCFSFMCISFISDYLFTQANNISHLFYERELDGDKLNEKISEIIKSVKEHQRNFFQDENDFLWLIVFKFGFVLNFVGYYYTNYLSFYFSFHYFKLIYKVFGRNYSVRCLRLLYGFLFFVLITTNHLLSLKNDDIIFELLGIKHTGITYVIKCILKFIGIIYVIGLVMINNDFFFNFKKDNNNELFDGDAEELLRNVEISATIEKKKKKRTKTIEIIIKEPTFKFSSIVYVQLDLFLNYFNICLMFYLIKEVEKSYIILCLYIFCLAIFIIRILFIISEMKNDYEYLIAFMISLMLGIRLMTITKDYSPLYVCSCFYLLLLVTLYCIVDRRRFLITFLILFHLFSACIYFTSSFLLILMAILICLPTAFKNEDKKFSHSTATVLIPCIVIVLFQLYGLKNIFAKFYEFEELVKEAFKFNVFVFVQKIVHGYSKEFYLISKIFELIYKLN